MTRLNDTAAIAGAPLEAGEEHSICVRKISNGFLTRQSTYNPSTGESRCTEQYSKLAPKIAPARISGARSGTGSTLADTKAYLGKNT